MTQPLSDPLPLRDTSVWPGYDTLTFLPRVYGRAQLHPVRYNEAGTLYVVADHAVEAVDAVTLNGHASDFRWRNGADLTGHGVAFIELARAPDTSATLVADVRGLSGNPADILADINPRSDLRDFAIECRNQGLILGGVLDTRLTRRAAISHVLDQVGAVWSAGLPGFATRFPPPPDGPLWATLGVFDVADWSVSCTLGDVVTRLTVPFDVDADGTAQQSVVLEAPIATRSHGERLGELALPWVRSARQAVATASAWLQWRARPLWTLQGTLSVQYRHLQPGGWIRLHHPQIPCADAVITDLDPGYGSGTVTLTAQSPAGMPPAVRVVRHSNQFAPIQTDYQAMLGADVVELTITDASGKKLPGAKVWVDDQGPFTTDADATVRVQPQPGTHVVRVELDGRALTTTTFSL